MELKCRVGNMMLMYDYENEPNAMYVESDDQEICGWEEFESDRHYADVIYDYLGDGQQAMEFVMKIAKIRK